MRPVRNAAMPQHNAPQSVSKHIRDPTRSVVVHHQTFGLSPIGRESCWPAIGFSGPCCVARCAALRRADCRCGLNGRRACGWRDQSRTCSCSHHDTTGPSTGSTKGLPPPAEPLPPQPRSLPAAAVAASGLEALAAPAQALAPLAPAAQNIHSNDHCVFKHVACCERAKPEVMHDVRCRVERPAREWGKMGGGVAGMAVLLPAACPTSCGVAGL